MLPEKLYEGTIRAPSWSAAFQYAMLVGQGKVKELGGEDDDDPAYLVVVWRHDPIPIGTLTS